MKPSRVPQRQRHPRHDALGTTSCEVFVTLSSRDPVVGHGAELANVSRKGLQLTLAEPLPRGERVTVGIRHEEGDLDITLAAVVRWQRPCPSGGWSVGCEFDETLSYEFLGELFLRGVLSTGAIE